VQTSRNEHPYFENVTLRRRMLSVAMSVNAFSMVCSSMVSLFRCPLTIYGIKPSLAFPNYGPVRDGLGSFAKQKHSRQRVRERMCSGWATEAVEFGNRSFLESGRKAKAFGHLGFGNGSIS